MTATTLDQLVGPHKMRHTPTTDVRHPFDSDANGIAFSLGDTVYLVFEDPSDGYRSHAGPLLSYLGDFSALGCRTYNYCDLDVVCSMRAKGPNPYDHDCEILEVRVASTGDLILEVGTENSDDYYPSFIARWTPPTR